MRIGNKRTKITTYYISEFGKIPSIYEIKETS
jgi:hypothetical protein